MQMVVVATASGVTIAKCLHGLTFGTNLETQSMRPDNWPFPWGYGPDFQPTMIGVNMEKFTSGPWTVQKSSNLKNGSAWRDIVSNSGEFSPVYIGAALDKNAHLISAAPDLYQALKGMLELFADTSDMEDYETVQFARQAIAKACP